jgi:general secretion pathway protein D
MKLLLLALSVTVSALGAQTLVASEPSEIVSEVISIKYARALDVAAVLLRMSTSSDVTSTAASSPSAVSSYTMPPNPAKNINTNNGFTQRLQNVVHRASTSGDLQNSGQPPIIADERTNSLLISATPQDMQRFKDTISRLDVAAVQVLIEATIIQVPGGGSTTQGISYLGGETPGPAGYSFGAGALSRSNMLSLTRLVPIAETNAAASQPSGFEYLAEPGTELDVMLPALASDSRVKILQRPSIKTSDGIPASMFVGEARPYPTGTGTGAGASTGASSSQQVLIGVTFEVTPAVKSDGTVEMDIHQKIDRFEGNVTIQNVGDVPVTSSIEAQAKVVVRDRETILLGGLIETGKPRTPSGVPLLKDIPLLGTLFRSSSASTAPNEIIVLIRPTILPGS